LNFGGSSYKLAIITFYNVYKQELAIFFTEKNMTTVEMLIITNQ